VAGKQSNDLFFAQANFAETVLNLRSRAQLFDAHGDTGFHAIERTPFTSDPVVPNCAEIADIHGISFTTAMSDHYTHFAIYRPKLALLPEADVFIWVIKPDTLHFTMEPQNHQESFNL